MARIAAGLERKNLATSFPVALPLHQIADAGEGYVALIPARLLGCLGLYLTDAFLTNAEFTSEPSQCLPSATANENGLLPFCEFAQIGGDCWRSLISLKIACLFVPKRGNVQGLWSDRRPWHRRWV